MRYANTYTKNENKIGNITKILQILQFYYIFKKHLHFIKIMYIMSVAKQKKYSNKKRIFYKNLHII
jgi:hypothetical protein